MAEGIFSSAFCAEQFDMLLWQKCTKRTDGIGSTAQTCKYGIGKSVFDLQDLLQSLISDYTLKIAHHFRVRMRTDLRAQQIKRLRIFDIITQCSIYCVFKGGAAFVGNNHFSA